MRLPTSYFNEKGNLIFAYRPENNWLWFVAERRKTKDGSYAVSAVREIENKRTTEEKAKRKLHAYARLKGFRPAY